MRFAAGDKERLGAGISKDFLYARRNTVPEKLAGTFSLTSNSCAPELYSLIEKEHALNGGADDKTLVHGCYELLGLPRDGSVLLGGE